MQRGEELNNPTWRHVEGGSATKLCGIRIGGGKTEVGQFDLAATLGNQYVLRLQVPVVHTQPMAVGYSIQDLQKSILCGSIITNILTSFCNIREEIPLRAVLHDHIDMVRSIHNPQKGYYVRVGRDLIMQAHFSLLKELLPAIQG
jgi:hypothetical protein